MKIFIATDIRLTECNGKYYIIEALSTIFRRYYTCFGKIVLHCRVVKVDKPENEDDISDILEQVIPMKNLLSMLSGKENSIMKKEMQNCSLVIGRFHSISACIAADCARQLGKPFFAEVMGDTWDGYWNHGIAGKLIAPYLFLKTKRSVKDADYALYVTREFLQKRYPCNNESLSASNVRITNIDQKVLERRLAHIRAKDVKSITLMTSAAVDVHYKGQEYVIRAIPKLNRAGVRVKYVLVGGGDQTYLKNVAEKCGVMNQVEFTGRMSLADVFKLLDDADIYLQPSLQEGLPRSVIEAMSRACPVIGAKTAGIPELIAPECVVRRKSAQDIADTILAIWNEEKLSTLAKQNFENAGNYLDVVLSKRRNEYFSRIKHELDWH